MRDLVVTRLFPGNDALEADMRANRPTIQGAPSFAERGALICGQALGYDASSMALPFPDQDVSESEWNEYHSKTLALEEWFIADRLSETEFINQFMTWGFDITDGKGRRLLTSRFYYRVMEGLARGRLVPKPSLALAPWRRPRIARVLPPSGARFG